MDTYSPIPTNTTLLPTFSSTTPVDRSSLVTSTPVDGSPLVTSTTEETLPHPGFIQSVPNYFLYSEALWSVKIALPLALLLQTAGHLLLIRVWKRQKRRCDCYLNFYIFPSSSLRPYTHPSSLTPLFHI